MPFLVIPAIDLRGGRVVRLRQGDFAQETAYAEDPVAVAREWDRRGAAWIHVVDLDGAKAGEPRHLDVAAAMAAAVRARIELGGGFRSGDHVARAFARGVARIVLGTAAIREPRLLEEAAAGHPGQVALGIDARGGAVAISGWQEGTAVKAVDLARRFAPLPLAAVIYTDIGRDGMLAGPDTAGLVEMARAAGHPVIASGGVSRLEDIRALRALEGEGVAGVIVGRALYEGTLTLEDALRAAGAHAG
ncbi:MAG TPA: 1-(5-phosphoribosyl)-5-[(5-phosphoribosylamino)methylideneamino]imidazole-4-carboxamide isomerase [Candidatus Sulfotelmatobacter sp.]|nr:1-(5-phosphoribosyl)-5-[(5-phosphoribosylamino)methylideneamino]imidazole-4-carboxamide isomerase [Candidatus Sulfotelmatobacter sp.]